MLCFTYQVISVYSVAKIEKQKQETEGKVSANLNNCILLIIKMMKNKKYNVS